MNLGSNSEVEHVLDLARDRSVAGRERLAAAVADLYHDQRSSLKAVEQTLMLDIFHRLVSDVEQSVRAALAQQLSTMPEAPHEIVRALAEDTIGVARAVLLNSPVLSDPDLIEIVEHRSLGHRLAIAMRQPLNAAVCDALVQTGNTPVLVATIGNERAAIMPATMALLVERSRNTPELHQPLVDRHYLDPVLARRLVSWVSSALRARLASRVDLPLAAIDQALARSADDVLRHRGPSEAGEAGALADHLSQSGAISPALFVQVLRHGDVSLFEALFSRVTGLNLAKVRRMAYEPSGRSLATLCRASGIEKAEFASIFVLLRSAEPTQAPLDAKTIGAVLAFFENTTLAGATAAVDFIRREAGPPRRVN
ncbi:MAG: DUF2336 domain-containing protein [Alphaproteobacteria bacterium]|nr:DUF2336 domain-containing protein [Alphaproteobacteria bacterium]